MNRLLSAAVAAFLIVASAATVPASAAVRPADPTTLPAVLKAAQAGDTITLAAGEYGDVQLPRGDFSPAIEIDARAASFTGVFVRQTAGINIRGGRVRGTGNIAVSIADAKRVTIAGMVVSLSRVGIGVTRSTDVELIGNRLDGVRSDGINLAMVQRVRVIGNQCINFTPIYPTFDAKGKLLKDGDHPDCIQGWSRLAYPPTSDILIEGNTSYGRNQGIWFGDPGQGGYDRITIRNNDLTLGYFQGISVTEGRDVTITGNRVRPIPGIKTQNFPFQPVKPWIKMVGGSKLTVCGNEVPAMPGGEGTLRCK